MKKTLIVLMGFICSYVVLGQSFQTVSGVVTDQVTQAPLIGATVYVKYTDPVIGTTTDENGRFELHRVPLGRAWVVASYVGYNEFTTEAFIVTSAKEVVLNIRMEEGISIEGVSISAVRDVNTPLNELAYVSARSFSPEETERIPASVNDVSKMALSFPGTQQAANDIENDIIVRGNSSFGMTWHLEGMEIPNPNHFARIGTAGGGISILSSQLMSRSDFYTGGMPADFGNTLSAAFDIRLKNGNLNQYENRFKLGLLGMDYALEGPVKKDKSSFIFNYRYSTLGLLGRFGIEVMGPKVLNEFTDFSFNIFTQNTEKRTKLNIFGMGGLSDEFKDPYPLEDRDLKEARHWEDFLFGSRMGTIGAIFTKLLDNSSYLKASVAATGSFLYREYDTLSITDEPFRVHETKYYDNRFIASLIYSKKFDSGFRIKSGLIGNLIQYDFFNRSFARGSTTNIAMQEFDATDVMGGGFTQTFQAYTQATYPVSKRLTAALGAHYLFFAMNQTMSVDPRASFRFQINRWNQLSLSVGKFSKIMPFPAYAYYERDSLPDGSIVETNPNLNLRPVNSNHYILSYHHTTSTRFKLLAEAYYQQLYNVPVPVDPENTYSMLNSYYEFPKFDVSNEGKGKNYGIDLSLEKYFKNNIYLLITGSLFDSQFMTNTGQWFHTRFAANWVSALTVGREFDFGRGRVLQIGTRLIHNGGHRYTPLDEAASDEENMYIGLSDQVNTMQLPAYWRIDGRIAYRFSRPKYAMNISFDLANITAHKNPSSMGYNVWDNVLYVRYHPGDDFIPLLNIQIDF